VRKFFSDRKSTASWRVDAAGLLHIALLFGLGHLDDPLKFLAVFLREALWVAATGTLPAFKSCTMSAVSWVRPAPNFMRMSGSMPAMGSPPTLFADHFFLTVPSTAMKGAGALAKAPRIKARERRRSARPPGRTR
jgi:hypothetical protein